MRVFTQDVRIVFNKLLKGLVYALIVFCVSLLAGFAYADYAAYGAMIFALLESLKKGLDEYNNDYADKFLWFFNKVLQHFKGD